MVRAVRENMIPDPVTVSISASIKDVLDKMNDYNVSHLLVMGDDGLQGIISKSDLLSKTNEVVKTTSGHTYSNIMLSTIKAENIMSENPSTVNADDPSFLALQILLQKQIHCLPVMREDELVGIVTFYDLLKNYDFEMS